MRGIWHRIADTEHLTQLRALVADWNTPRRLEGVGVLAVKTHHPAVGDGEVGLGADAGGVPVLDQGAQ